MALDIAAEDFEDEVLKSDIPVMADFWAPWCGSRYMIASTTEKLSKEYKGKLELCKLNENESPHGANAYQVMSISSLLFCQAGQKVDEILGAVSDDMIRPKVGGCFSLSCIARDRLYGDRRRLSRSQNSGR